MFKPRNRYKDYKILRNCPICDKEYDVHWKVVSHIRKTVDKFHQEFLKQQEEEVVKIFKENTGRVDDLADDLYKIKNIFCGISYMRIVEILEKYIQKKEIRKIQKQRISRVMKNVLKTKQHNKNVSDAVKKAWKDGTFDTEEYKKAKELGYKKRRSYAGKNNPMYGKPSPKGAGRGKGGIRKDIGHYVRSTWEANLCRVCNLMDRDYKFEYKRFKIIVDGEDCTYCPDLYFPDKDMYYEIKGHAKSSTKWECTCDTCEKNKKKMKEVTKKYKIKIILIGNDEYKRFKRKFKDQIPNWEN